MISYLSGPLLEATEGRCTVAISAGTSKIGYAVHTPHGSAYQTLVEGENCEFFIHTHVREDALELFGFRTKGEREVFLTLLGVNGIGPKGAMGILSKVELGTLIDAVLTGDKSMLTGIPGIGKKTAERMILELGDPLKKKMEAGLLPMKGLTSIGGTGTASGAAGVISSAAFAQYAEAKEALVGLGYRELEIQKAFARLRDAGQLTGERKTAEVVRMSLKELK